MKIRVQRDSGSTEILELAEAEWRIVHIAGSHSLVGAGVAHAFNSDGFYDRTRPVPVIFEKDAERQGINIRKPKRE
jgi:hypothetical protein